jgi:REP element-mobilizing transposase RayT
MDRLLDRARSGPVFLRNPLIAQTLVASLEHGDEIGQYELHRWVILPNHVHLLVTPHVHLPQLLRRLKTWTARHSNAILGRAGCPFWQDESYDRLVRSEEEFRRITRYIDHNPVAAGLVPTPEEYPW